MSTTKQVTAAEIVVRMRADIAELKGAMGQATNEIRKFGAENRAQAQEARAAMALLGEEIGVRMPRHIRGFVAELPGVATAMSAAFNSVAVIGLITIVVEAGNKVYEFVAKNEEAAKKSAEAWGEAAKDVNSVNASLELSNSKIEDSIRKLEKKPASNGMKTALLEAAAEADKLGGQLDKDLDKIKDIKTASGIASLLGGGDTDIDRTAAFGAAQAERITSSFQETLRLNAEAGDKAGYNATRRGEIAELHKELDPTIHYLGEYLRKNQDLAITNPNQPEFAKARDAFEILSGVMKAVEQQGQQERGKQTVVALTPREKVAKVNDPIEKAELAALVQGMAEAKFAFMPSMGDAKKDPSVAANWDKNKAELEYQGQLAYLADRFGKAITDKDAPLVDGIRELINKLREEHGGVLLNQQSQQIAQIDRDDQEAQRKAQEEATAEAKRLAESMMKLTEQNAKAEKAFQDAELNWLAAKDRSLFDTGKISEGQALALHGIRLSNEEQASRDSRQQQFEAELPKFKTPEERQQAALNYDIQSTANDINYLTKEYEVQGAIFAASWRGGIDSVFDEFEVRSKQSGKQFYESFSEALGGINDEFTKFLNGQKTSWSQMFRGQAAGIAKRGLEDGEGYLFSGLNLGTKETAAQKGIGDQIGKTEQAHDSAVGRLAAFITGKGTVARGSSPESPIFTKSVDSLVPGGSASKDTNPLAKTAAGGLIGMLNDSNWASGLFGGKLFGSGSFFGGGRALGGDVLGGVAYDIGEHGPEQVVFPASGRVVPHNQLASSGPSIGYVDARGTDPVQTHAAIVRAMAMTHAQAVRDAGAAIQERSRRVAH